jgi:hypothetical protein
MTLVFFAATENPYKHLLKELKKPDGKVSNYYSLPDLKDPRIGECNSMLPCCLDWRPFGYSLQKIFRPAGQKYLGCFRHLNLGLSLMHCS